MQVFYYQVFYLKYKQLGLQHSCLWIWVQWHVMLRKKKVVCQWHQKIKAKSIVTGENNCCICINFNVRTCLFISWQCPFLLQVQIPIYYPCEWHIFCRTEEICIALMWKGLAIRGNERGWNYDSHEVIDLLECMGACLRGDYVYGFSFL